MSTVAFVAAHGGEKPDAASLFSENEESEGETKEKKSEVLRWPFALLKKENGRPRLCEA